MATASSGWLDKLLPTPTHDASWGQDSAILALGCVGAAVMMGRAMQLSNGMYFDPALLWLTWGIVSAFAGLLIPRTRELEALAQKLLAPAVIVGVAFNAGMIHSANPVKYMVQLARGDIENFHTALAAVAVLSAVACVPSPWLKRWHTWALLLTFLYLGNWAINASPDPHVDVIVYAREAAKALLNGQNPHSITIPNIYAPETGMYPPGVVENNRIMVGYPYPPINVLLFALGSILGDVRYALVLAITVGAGFVLFAQRTWWATAGVALLFLMPRNFLLIENCWNEPFAFLFLGAALYAAVRCPRYLPVALGLLITCKQYIPFLLPVVFLLPVLRGPKDLVIKQVGVALGIGALITLPFFLWSPSDFWRAAVDFHINGPVRTDALSYLSWWNAHYGKPMSPGWSYLAALLGMGLVWWRAPRTPSGVAFSFGFVCFLLMMCNRQAFVNYYWLSIASFCAALACSNFGQETAAQVEEQPAPKKKRGKG